VTELLPIALATGLPPLPLVAAAVVLLFVPGYALAALLLPAPRYRPLERLLAAPALTVALLALLTLWASVLGVPLGPPAALALLGVAVAAIGVSVWRARPPGRLVPALRSLPDALPLLPLCTYLGLFALALGLRLWSTRDLLPTLGADTYHHTLIAWLLVEHGGLPASYAPYAPITTFAYHFGFHGLVAWLHWWTGAGVGELVGLAGHLVNAAVALGVAFFVLRVLGDRLVALLAAWLVALLCVFPAYFANWGRFTQAGGLLLLPVAAALWLDLLRPACAAPAARARPSGAGASRGPGVAVLAGLRPPGIAASAASHAPRVAALAAPRARWAALATSRRPGGAALGALRAPGIAALAASGLLLAHYRMAAILALLLAVWGVYTVGKWLWAAREPVVRSLVLGVARADVGRRVADGEEQAVAVPPFVFGKGRAAAVRAVAVRSLVLGTMWAGSVRRVAVREGCAVAVRLVAAVLLALGLVAPWLAHLRSTLALGLGEQAGDYGAAYYGLERLGTAPDQPTNLLLLLLGGLGCALAWRRRVAPLLLLGGWAALQLSLANPYWWSLPMPLAGRVDLVTVVAALAFPLAVAAAYALAGGWRAGRARWPRAAAAGALVLVLGGTLLGGWQLAHLVTPENALVGPADLAAADWLRASTPPDARVAVRTVIFPWAPDYVVGIDAGYWLPLLAGRATTVLPMLYPGERGADPAATGAMVAVARALRDAPAAPETARLLRALGIGYVYDSGRPAAPALDGILASPAYRLVYDRDGVRVLAVLPE
jgi:hypothetical protein